MKVKELEKEGLQDVKFTDESLSKWFLINDSLQKDCNLKSIYIKWRNNNVGIMYIHL